ncbi:hypothetical protein F5884DRAFT_377024 [Xylogone sp. PMI_703]|nr:hypothetical protein F5884DRAFT_377024 [Xylogone sp. PMI_703]
MSDNIQSTRIIQALGITTAAFLSGAVGGVSYFLVPNLLTSPTPLLLKQWQSSYNSGKRTAPPIAAIASASFFYLASKTNSSLAKTKFYRYIAAGLLSVGIVPYTFAIMGKTNRRLNAKAEQTKNLRITDEFVEAGVREETAHWLVDHWGTLNLGRAALLLAAAGLGTWNALEL